VTPTNALLAQQGMKTASVIVAQERGVQKIGSLQEM